MLIPKREWHDGQRQMMGTKTCTAKVTTLCVMLRGACVSEFAFGRFGVTTAHASRLAQLECDVLIGAGGTGAL